MIQLLHVVGGNDIRVEVGGENYGPFRTDAEADVWRAAASETGVSLVTVRDLYTGRITAESADLLLPDGNGGWTRTPAAVKGLDYGKPIVEAEGVARRSLSAHAVALARGAVDNGYYEQDEERLEAMHGGEAYPHSIDVKPKDVVARTVTRCQAGPGELFLAGCWLPEGDGWDGFEYRDDGPKWLLAWRRDARERRGLWVLSAHDDAKCAVFELRRQAAVYRHFIEPRQTKTPDVQKQRVYDWENPFLYRGALGAKIPIERCNDICREVWDRMALPGAPPKAVFRPQLEKKSKYIPSRHEIWLAEWGMRSGIVLHELAHAVVAVLGLKVGKDVASHGPEFVAAAMALYEGFGGLDRAALESAAEAGGVRWGAPSEAFAAVLERAAPLDAGPRP